MYRPDPSAGGDPRDIWDDVPCTLGEPDDENLIDCLYDDEPTLEHYYQIENENDPTTKTVFEMKTRIDVQFYTADYLEHLAGPDDGESPTPDLTRIYLPKWWTLLEMETYIIDTYGKGTELQ